MNSLTNEEKNRIGDAAIAMMNAFAEWKIAEDRLNHIGTLAGRLLNLNLFNSGLHVADGTDVREVVLRSFIEKFKAIQLDFFNSLGIGPENKEFWEWCDSHNKEQTKVDHESNGILKKDAIKDDSESSAR